MQINLATFIFLAPVLVTAFVLKGRGWSWADVSRLLGWRLGPARSYIALPVMLAVTAAGVLVLALLLLPGYYQHPPRNVTTYVFSTMSPTPPAIAGALAYELFFTALGEEAFFRGLLAGALIRRFGTLPGIALQGVLFLLPHLLVLLIAPQLWWLVLLAGVGGLALGWLRARTGSIVLPLLLHAAGNTASDVLAMWVNHRPG